MQAIGPTPFKSFLTQLRKDDSKSPLTKEQIAEKIIKWLDAESHDKNREERLLQSVGIMEAQSSMRLAQGKNDTKNATYLQNKSHNGFLYYTTQVNAVFRPQYSSEPGLEAIFGDYSTKSRQGFYPAAHEIYRKTVWLLQKSGWSAEEKKRVAKGFSEYFEGSSEDIVAKSFPVLVPVNLSPEVHQIFINRNIIAPIKDFTNTVSKQEYEIYFKNIENEVVPPAGFFAKLRFDYSNDIAFAGRVFKYDFSNILQEAFRLVGIAFLSPLIMILLVLPVVCSIIFFVGVFNVGLVAAAAAVATFVSAIAANAAAAAASAATGAFVLNLLSFAAGFFVLSIPGVAATLHSEDWVNGYLFAIKMLLLTPVVAISSVFSWLFSKSDPVDEDPVLEENLDLGMRSPPQVVLEQEHKSPTPEISHSESKEVQSSPVSPSTSTTKLGHTPSSVDDLD